MSKDQHIPEHWEANSWEEKARENPLHAIMTVEGFREKTLADLNAGAPEEFLKKGRTIYAAMVGKFLTTAERTRQLTMFDYGCGAGRIMNAVVEAGHQTLGADISPTMIEACGKIVPSAKALVLVSDDGGVDLPDNSCDVAYSFAVVQHIKSLTAHNRAIDEMARIVKPGGLLALQVNCEDFETGTDAEPGYTVNFEEFSVHFSNPDQGPERVHEQNNWSGVYISLDQLIRQLNKRGFHLTEFFNWNPKKKRAAVFIARKESGENAIEPRPDLLSTVNTAMYRALLKKYARVAIDRNRFKKELKELKNRPSES